MIPGAGRLIILAAATGEGLHNILFLQRADGSDGLPPIDPAWERDGVQLPLPESEG